MSARSFSRQPATPKPSWSGPAAAAASPYDPSRWAADRFGKRNIAKKAFTAGGSRTKYDTAERPPLVHQSPRRPPVTLFINSTLVAHSSGQMQTCDDRWRQYELTLRTYSEQYAGDPFGEVFLCSPPRLSFKHPAWLPASAGQVRQCAPSTVGPPCL